MTSEFDCDRPKCAIRKRKADALDVLLAENQRLRQALEQHHAHYGPCRYCNMPERAVTPGAGGGQP